MAELMLRNKLGLIDQIEAIKQGELLEANPLFSTEMPEEVEKYVNYIIEQYNEAKALTESPVLLIEERVDLTDFIEDGFGTNDAIILTDGTLEVIDLKYGKGVRVNADDNSQLKLYGLGALNKYLLSYDIHTVRLTIVQPRLDHISSWEIKANELFNWGETIVKPTAVKAYAGEGEQVPGEWCRFCKAKAKCKALANQNLEAARLEFSDIPKELENYLELSDEELVKIYNFSSRITDWLKSINSHLLKEALKGKSWPGLKLVEGKSQRVWTNAQEVETTLLLEGYQAHEIFESKLSGITKIEKLVGKKNFEDLLGEHITKPPGAPTLVDLEDKRQPYGYMQAVNDFSEECEDLL
jgi:hypothetical protein